MDKTFVQLWKENDQDSFVKKMNCLKRASQDEKFNSETHPIIQEVKKDEEALFLCLSEIVSISYNKFSESNLVKLFELIVSIDIRILNFNMIQLLNSRTVEGLRIAYGQYNFLNILFTNESNICTKILLEVGVTLNN